MKFKKALSIIICIALLITLMPLNNVLAWKVKTHNYSANLILEEVLSSGGRVTIPPFRITSYNVCYTKLLRYNIFISVCFCIYNCSNYWEIDDTNINKRNNFV